MATDSLVLLHLSDIHFRYSLSGGPYDLDEVIRHELLLDAESLANSQGGVDAVLISGDIAFGGKQIEYETAYTWLNELCKRTNCAFSRVWTVPGNHDIDRTRIKGNPLAEMQRNSFREVPLERLNDSLRLQLEDAQSRDLLFAPLEQYNVFANKLGSVSTPNPLYWEKELQLNDQSILRIRGLNSTLISDENDSDEERKLKLILSSFQTNFFRESSVTYMTICHHPLEWLRDSEIIEDWLNEHSRIQLFGHRHRQRITPIADNVRISSGAMHPDRSEAGWEPRFNLMALKVTQKPEGRTLNITVDPRVWNDTAKKFLQDPLGQFGRALPLPDWKPISSGNQTAHELSDSDDQSVVVEAIKPDLIELEQSTAAKDFSMLNAGEKLTSRYISLPKRIQRSVAVKLELISDSDEGVSSIELYRRYFHRAKERKLLESLWNEVENIYVAQGEQPSKENPFLGK